LKTEERKRDRKKKRRAGEGISLRRFVVGRGMKSLVLLHVSPVSPNLNSDTRIMKEERLEWLKMYTVYKNSAPSSQKTRCVCSRSVFFREIVAAYCENLSGKCRVSRW
jgi:hypothetical protein